jgi:hypothetical protein
MKNLLIALLFLPVMAAAQQLNPHNNVFKTAADLSTQTGVHNTLYSIIGLNTMIDRNGGPYLYDSTSLATPDGFSVVKPNGVPVTNKGRFLKQSNPNTLKVLVTVTGVITQTAYPISFGTTLPMVPVMVIPVLQSSSFVSAPGVTNITASGCTLNFASVLSGTFTFNLLIIKY